MSPFGRTVFKFVCLCGEDTVQMCVRLFNRKETEFEPLFLQLYIPVNRGWGLLCVEYTDSEDGDRGALDNEALH